MQGRPLKILESPTRVCAGCKLELPLWTEFYHTGRTYYRRICKTCYHLKHEKPRVRPPGTNKAACRKYYRKKRSKNRYICFTCPAKLDRDNPSGYCLQCYLLSWLGAQWRNFQKQHIGDNLAKQRREALKFLNTHLISLPNGHLFPAYRLKHIQSVKWYPEKAFTLGNIEWVPVNLNLSNKHRRVK